MISLIRPQAEFLRQNVGLLNDVRVRPEAVLFLPFRNWVASARCPTSPLAAELARANLQFEVICEDDLRAGAEPRTFGGKFPAAAFPILPAALHGTRLLLAAANSDFTEGELNLLQRFKRAGGSVVTAEQSDWHKEVLSIIGQPSVRVEGPASVRAKVLDQSHRTVVHLLNLNVKRLSSFEDKVTPVTDLHVAVRVPLKKVHSVRALTADTGATSGALRFTCTTEGSDMLVQTALAKLEIATILVVE